MTSGSLAQLAPILIKHPQNYNFDLHGDNGVSDSEDASLDDDELAEQQTKKRAALLKKQAVWEGFKEIASRIERLRLENQLSSSVPLIIPQFNNIRSLVLCYPSHPAFDPTNNVFKAISNLPSLLDLRLLSSCGAVNVPTEASTNPTRLRLTSLEIQPRELLVGTWSFIEILGNTLQTLSLKSTDSRDKSDSYGARSSFPRLQSFRFQGNSAIFADIITFLQAPLAIIELSVTD